MKPFLERASQLVTGYHVKCTDDVDVVRNVVRALKGETVVTNGERSDVLRVLCRELGFRTLKHAIDRGAQAESMYTVIFERCFARQLSHVQDEYVADVEEYGLDINKPLNGIIARMSRLHGGNVCEKGIVDVIADSTTGNDTYEPASLWSWGKFQSICEPNQSFCYDFKDRRVAPSAYTIRSGSFLWSWVIEVSNVGSQWLEIDRRGDNHELDEIRVASFPVRFYRESYRMIRIRQTLQKGPDEPEYLIGLELSAFEIFGRTRHIEEPDVVTDFPVNISDPLTGNGIIAYLYRTYCGTVCERAPGEAWASGTNCFDAYSSEERFVDTMDRPSKGIVLDFKSVRVKPCGCAIECVDEYFPSSWAIEGSDDGIEWIEIDRQEECDKFDWKHLSATFEIGYCSKSYKLLRIRQIERRRPIYGFYGYGGRFRLCFSALELFGSIEL